MMYDFVTFYYGGNQVLVPSSLDNLVVLVLDKAVSSKAGGYIAKLYVVDTNGKVLKEGTDYTIKGYTVLYPDGSTVEANKKSIVDTLNATITVSIEGKGAYEGTATASYQLIEKNFSGVKLPTIAKIYTGKAIELDASDFQNEDGGSKVTMKDGKTVKTLVYGQDFEIIEGTYSNNVKMGTASVMIRGCGAYGGVVTLKFKIAKRSLFGLAWRL